MKKLKSYFKEGTEYRLKDLLIQMPKSDLEASSGEEEGLYPFYTSSQELSKKYNEAQYEGDSLILGTGGMASVNYSAVPYSSSTDCWNLKAKRNVKFLYYYLTGIKDSVINDQWFRGMGLKHLQKGKLLSHRLTLPSDDDCNKIANYLDTKCSTIDFAISKIQTEIEKLEEYKKAVIKEAVTKGLDKDAILKETNIPWYGEIPGEWSVQPIKNIFKVVSGGTPDSKEMKYWDGEINWITPADFKTVDHYVSHGANTITSLGYDSCSATVVPSGSIIISKRAPIGSVAIASNELCTNQGCLSCVNKNKEDSEYYYYLLSILEEQLNLYGQGTTFKEISAKQFSNFRILIPTKEAKMNISQFLKKEEEKVNKIVNTKRTIIEKLYNFKRSLIYEYVTGKRGVPVTE